jgi:hypothetical protein
MPIVNLKLGEPLVLTLAADPRLAPTTYPDDQIWELSMGGGEPPSLAIRTTFGLRARSFRIFPRFIIKDAICADPATFAAPVVIKYLAPNFIRLACEPHPGINVEIEYWVPTSQSLTGRARLTNNRAEYVSLLLEWVSLLTPDSTGQRMAPLDIGLFHLLAGRTGALTPIFYLTGITQPEAGPFTALASQFELKPRQTGTATWFEAAQSNPEIGFSLVQQLATRNWDAEVARIERINASQLDIHTGNPDWDTAFTLAQKTARGLVLSNPGGCPHPSTVSTRLPDQGFSIRGDGSDYTHLWDGQTLYDLYYLFDLLMPGEPNLIRGFLENFLASQTPEGHIPLKPGLGGQLNKLTAPPLLAGLVWRYYQRTEDVDFLRTSFPGLLSFVQSWFDPQHDRDGDGIPEWDHPLQTGIDDHPIFAHWYTWSQGLDISMVEGPDLCAYLHAEIDALIQMAHRINQPESIPSLQSLADHLTASVEASWNESLSTYQYWDRESHQSPPFEVLGDRLGSGTILLDRQFPTPVRLIIRIKSTDESTRPAHGFIHGTGPSGGHRVERFSADRFRWVLGNGNCTSERIYTKLEHIEIQGLLDTDQVTLQTLSLNCREQSLLLPLWAGIPSPERAKVLIKNTITNNRLFWGAYGLRACAEKPDSPEAANYYHRVHMLWNSLVGEGLLRYGQRHRAADLVTRLMNAITQNLKQEHAFFRSYLASNGYGLGDRNSLLGLAPLGLFLQVIGVQIITPYRVHITGPNPFPWPITVKYKGLTIIQHKRKAMIIFPDGQSVTQRNDKPHTVSIE